MLVAASARLAGAAEIVVTDLFDEALAKGLELIGTFLSHEEFRWAVEMLVQGRIDIGPILTGEFLLADAISAFELASDRSKATQTEHLGPSFLAANLARSTDLKGWGVD